MERAFLTIIVPAYNVEKYLEQCLDSLVNQTIIAHKVIVVNDGSTDSTAEIAMEYQEKYPDTFRLINKENGGWGSTLNVGIKNAIGKYFKQLDGDAPFRSGAG